MESKIKETSGTSLTLTREGKEALLSNQEIAIRRVNKVIKEVLDKYNKDWFLNEFDVDQELMSDIDSEFYSNMFDSRERLLNLRIGIVNLFKTNL